MKEKLLIRSQKVILFLLFVTALSSGYAQQINGSASKSDSRATSIMVTNSSDSGEGSLRQAIIDIADAGTITFLPGLNISLNSSLIIAEYKSFVIDGTGSNVVITGNDAYQVFNITGKTDYKLTLNDLTITGGLNTDSNGGGIYADMNASGSELNVTNCRIINNTAYQKGGGVYATGNCFFSDCLIANNLVTDCGVNSYSGGAGIYVINGTNFNRCTITQNRTTGTITQPFADGGGVFVYNGGTFTDCDITYNVVEYGDGGGVIVLMDANFYNCNISNNQVLDNNNAGQGSGVRTVYGGTFVNCTISNNAANTFEGGVFISNDGNLINCQIFGNDGYGVLGFEKGTITNCTITGNLSGLSANTGMTINNCLFWNINN